MQIGATGGVSEEIPCIKSEESHLTLWGLKLVLCITKGDISNTLVAFRVTYSRCQKHDIKINNK